MYGALLLFDLKQFTSDFHSTQHSEIHITHDNWLALKAGETTCQAAGFLRTLCCATTSVLLELAYPDKGHTAYPELA